VQSNGALLAAARRAAPDAYLIYKPHPDVEAGLRLGALSRGEAAIADEIATRSDANSLLARADHVWTMTSLIGFEALLRGIPVTCAGVPFYAGWGLTTDLGPVPSRRRARPSLEALVWAALIAYPRYVDPEIGRATTPERLVARLATGRSAPRGSLGRQALSAAQSALGALGLVRWR
ncbi:MAG: capsular polysaccharide biosynthesis protein, partial [Pseudomonadota bacterium]